MTATNRRQFLTGLAATASVPFVAPGVVERYLVSKLGVPASAQTHVASIEPPASDSPPPGAFYVPASQDQLSYLLRKYDLPPGIALAY